MTAPICTSRRCTSPATHALPAWKPGAEQDAVCRECYDAYFECLAALEENDPGYD